MNTRILATPVGKLRLVANEAGLKAIEFEHGVGKGSENHAEDKTLVAAATQLQEYFKGERKTFDLPLAPEGTEFQMSVWCALRDIPWGRVCSYADIALAIDKPTATRAVGAANGRNPLPIVIPCHRVIGSDGSLTGFAGGLHMKRQLLELEGSLQDGQYALL
ncbi:MAG: methylated-DNA--[protein]-cysteine S-methyltransferase [Pseudomonadota bacterium]